MRSRATHTRWSVGFFAASSIAACTEAASPEDASAGGRDSSSALDDCDACVDEPRRDDASVGAGATDAGRPDAMPEAADSGEGAPPFEAGLDDIDSGVPSDAGAITLPNHPGELLDLTNWKLTVPVETDHPGNPDEYRNPALQVLSLAPHFTLTPARDGVAFRAHAGGATTPNSLYPRSELREMIGGGTVSAAWSTSTGVHRMRVRQAITHLTSVKPHVVSAQIHDAQDDVIMIRLQNRHLFVEGGSDTLGTLDANYTLGTVFTVELVASEGKIDVFYNGLLKVSVPKAAADCYFKAGCYTQSNVARGEAPEDYAEVVIYELIVSHE